MREVSIGFSRIMLRSDIGYPCKPAGRKQNGWRSGHPYDYEADMKKWPRWRRRFHFVRLNTHIPDAEPAWRLLIYSKHGAKAVDLFWRHARWWRRVHLHLPRTY